MKRCEPLSRDQDQRQHGITRIKDSRKILRKTVRKNMKDFSAIFDATAGARCCFQLPTSPASHSLRIRTVLLLCSLCLLLLFTFIQRMLDKVMNLSPLSGLPKPKSGEGEGRLRMRNIFAAPLDAVTKELDDLKNILTPKNEEQYEFLDAALSDHFVFQHLNDKEKKRLMDAMSIKSVEKGTHIITQGEPGKYLYVIQEGTVQFLVDGIDVGQGERGTIFGELSLLYDCPTAASVICTTDCQLWRVSQYTFRRIKAAHALSNDDETRSTIQSISFFKDLPNEYIYRLADSLLERKFQKGDVLATKGHKGDTL